MNKQEAIINLSTIFNRGSSIDSDAIFFKNKKHDDLLDILMHYIQNSSHLIGNPKIYKTQALNDHGVDLIVEFPNNVKIGIQVKSHFDVSQKDFAQKVKAQMAESQYHGLDKWYLFLCSPLKDEASDFSAKISHLINELSSYKTSYHIVYSPQQAHSIFTKDIITSIDFQSIKNQFYYEQVDWSELFKAMSLEKKNTSYLSKVEMGTITEIKTGNLYLKHLGLPNEKQEQAQIIKELKDLQTLLRKLSKPTREFLYATLSRVVKSDRIRQVVLTPCKDLQNFLSISQDDIKNEVSILENYGIASFDDDYESGNWYVAIGGVNPDYNILEEIKDFSEKNSKSLEDIIVNLNFSHFDN